ncbi:MAG: methylmalonyl-CoA mutase, partial [Pedobacter sp.]
QVIAFESGVTDTVDPLAGSYFVESLTDEIEIAALAYIDKIDAMGGSVNAIENGYIQQEIANASYQYQKEVEQGERIIVGVNKFTQEKEGITDVLNIDESIRVIQTDKLNSLKAERNNEAVKLALDNLTAAAKSERNLMPFILSAVEEYATLGEIADCMRNVFGEY